jgi:chromatin remodeling complex protein RSC6
MPMGPMSPMNVDAGGAGTSKWRGGRRDLCELGRNGSNAAFSWYSPSTHFERLPKGDRMAKAAKKSARKPNAAFMKPVQPSEALSEVVGSKPIPRTEVTKKLWLYIKKNKLQDPKNKRMIKADPTLKTVFGGKATVNMFEMTKLVGKHLK